MWCLSNGGQNLQAVRVYLHLVWQCHQLGWDFNAFQIQLHES